MPTALTHGIVGCSLVQLAPRALPRWRVLVLLVTVSLLPDLDVIGFGYGIPYEHPFGHRGFSHSLLFALLVAGLATAVMLALERSSGPAMIPVSRWWGLLLLTTLAGASHGLLDAVTSGGLGIGLLLPFSNERIFFAVRPIRVSPINPFAFSISRALRVFGSEAVWVWLPLALASLPLQVLRAVQRRRCRQEADRQEVAPDR